MWISRQGFGGAGARKRKRITQGANHYNRFFPSPPRPCKEQDRPKRAA